VTKTWLIPFLEQLAEFLNHDFNREERKISAEAAECLDSFEKPGGEFHEGWKRNDPAIKAKYDALYQRLYPDRSRTAWPFAFSADRDLQTELRGLLNPVITNGKGFRESLGALVGRVAELRPQSTVRVRPANKKAMRIEQAFRDDLKERARRGDIDIPENIEEVKQVSSAQSFLKLHGMRWGIDVEPWPTDASSYFLWVIDAALKEGELSRLRVCRYCHRYFTAKNRSAKRIACSDQCRVEYWNKRHQESGYYNKIRKMKQRKRIDRSRRSRINPQPRKE
jgi:hypothetical protein